MELFPQSLRVELGSHKIEILGRFGVGIGLREFQA